MEIDFMFMDQMTQLKIEILKAVALPVAIIKNKIFENKFKKIKMYKTFILKPKTFLRLENI